MRLYYDHEKVIATHDDDLQIDANVYGDNIEVMIVPDDIALEPFGAKPAKGEIDTRVFKKIPVLSDEDNSSQMKMQSIEKVRAVIAKNIGDTPSLVGTLADSTGLLIAIALADIVALSSSSDFAKYKKTKLDTITALAGDADVAAMASDALDKIKSGDALLTASLKGVDNVIKENLARSTAVTAILSQQNAG